MKQHLSMSIRSISSAAQKIRRRDFTGVVHSALRSTQAAESLREAFARSSGAKTVVTSTDLDAVVGNLKTRPSALVDVYSGLGFFLGTSSRLLTPLPFVPGAWRKALVHSVDEAVRRSINDDLRDMNESEEVAPTNEASQEVKETLKYHRDISLSSEEASDEFAESKIVNALTAGIHSAIRITNKI